MSHKKDDFSVGICFSLTSFLTEMWKLFCSSGRHHEHEERSARHSFFSTTYPCIWNWCGKFGLAEKNLTSRTLLEDPHFLSDWFTTQQLNWQLPYRSKLKVRFGQKSKILKQCKQRFKENVEKIRQTDWFYANIAVLTGKSCFFIAVMCVLNIGLMKFIWKKIKLIYFKIQ